MSTGVWEEIGSPSSVSVQSISGRFVSDYYLGKLNASIDTCYSGASGCVVPPLGLEEQGIYSEMYKNDYYGYLITQTLGAGGIQWTEIREGDEVIRRTSPTEIAKVYKDLKRESDEALQRLIISYTQNGRVPNSVDFYNIQKDGCGC